MARTWAATVSGVALRRAASPSRCVDERLAGGPDQHGMAGGGQRGDSRPAEPGCGRGSCRIRCRDRCRSPRGRSRRHAASGHPIHQEVPHLGDHVVVVGIRLHGARGALHVHQHHPGAGSGHHAGHVRVAEGGDVVDHHRTGLEGGGRHHGLGGVDRHQHPGGGEGRHHRHHPIDLVGGGHGGRPGTGGLAAHIDQVGTGLGHGRGRGRWRHRGPGTGPRRRTNRG